MVAALLAKLTPITFCSDRCLKELFNVRQSQQFHAISGSHCKDNTLICEEDGSCLEPCHEPVHRDPPGTALVAATTRSIDFFDAADARDVIRNELTRLQEVRFEPTLPEARRFSEDDRPRIVSWLVQVVTALELTKETLHSAVSLVDRYITATEAHPPEAVLQLLALGCLSTAAKHEEVAQRSSDEWVRLAVDADSRSIYERLDLNRMEWLLLETVEWRIRVPNTLTFMRQYQAVLMNRGLIPGDPESAQLFKEHAEFMAEVSLLYNEFLNFGYSTVAVAALTLAAWYSQSASGAELSTRMPAVPVIKIVSDLAAFVDVDVSCLAPGLDRCMELMNHLHSHVVGRHTWGCIPDLGLLEPVATRYPQVFKRIDE
ncbi:hypothetical protein VOLCADRAFT_99592 [Volvox carteri f. nagariensis]|uniref:Cyclin-like domain-containing protein n=1 Tax=Volvox carteri f. nagariensis TaxID=3068 RepID=D8UI49_VOLCA|nr:uncharacterized protein VOLCADRAFT_99592 [Volvox carteri f. nagariensis]EFJ40612.1 hypothetical protein VOLCADRAFT_99592 [Volvox carteri f. nagariensis]|eukprot:XP_002958319.1 hypothetical protein VOLCADRAFT_99592 [Volvox carteri f. nagariensis]